MRLRESTSSASGFQKFHLVAGSLFFVIMAIYAIVYAAERVTYVDSAWLGFERINGEQFTFPGDRYGAFFSQILLFIGVKLSLSFKTLVYLFSISYVVLYCFIWWLCTRRLKNQVAGLLVIFGMVIGIRESFIHIVSETHQCIAFSALLYALLHYTFQQTAWLRYVVVGLVTVLILYTHPLGIFTAGFVIAYYFAEKKDLKDGLLWTVVLLIVLGSLNNYFNAPNPYDQTQYNKLAGGNANSLADSGALQFLSMHIRHFYWLPLIALVVSLFSLGLKKEWFKQVVFICSVSGFIVIASVTFSEGDSSIMIERLFIPAFFMVNLCLAESIQSFARTTRWIPIGVTLFFLVNGIRIINSGCLMYKKRVAYLDEIVQLAIAQGNDKYFLSEERTNRDKIMVAWGLGVETLMYSKFKYDTCVSVTMKDEICQPTEVHLTNFKCLPVNDLNPEYFQLSARPYTELK